MAYGHASSDIGQGASDGRDPIVDQIIRSGHQRQLTFRAQFAITWLILIVGIVYLLAGGRRGLDGDFIVEWFPFILGGAATTVAISGIAIVGAVVLAIFGAMGRLSVNPWINGTASLYVSLVRGTPLLVQIFFAYYALAEVGLVLPGIVAGTAALAFNYGAYMTEVFRAGIQAVPRGQREAARALGMRERVVFWRIVIPQAFRIVTPAIGNEFIAMLKDSSLVFVIGVGELLWRAQAAGRPNVRIFEALLVAALVYWILTIIFTLFQERLERRMARADR
ncbi:MAG TPA: amino acid ABC transporter permease [Candidatus Limnocylindrales bacterium]|nr:amino acid ABC transporter permease [Candidatus Limnocylindrales bacterium]